LEEEASNPPIYDRQQDGNQRTALVQSSDGRLPIQVALARLQCRRRSARERCGKGGDLELAFLTTLTVFNAPQNVTLEEL